MSIEVANESGVEVDEAELIDVAAFVIARMDVHPAAELSITLVDKDTMADLHVTWMNLPGPTDVMSFPMDELRPGSEDAEPQEGVLGDIVLCPEVAARQAERFFAHPTQVDDRAFDLQVGDGGDRRESPARGDGAPAETIQPLGEWTRQGVVPRDDQNARLDA